MSIFEFLFGKREPKMTFDEVVEDMEKRWEESGITDSLLIDYMENIIGEYEDKMKRRDYEMLRDCICFDWEESTQPQFI